MTKDDIKAAINTLISRAAGTSGDSIDVNRQTAMDYYLMRPRGDEETGRSRVISGDVSAMTDAVLSQMLNAFTTDNVVELEANGPEDEEQVQLESAIVSHQVMEMNAGYMAFQQSIKDALLMRNGIIKVYVDEKISTQTKTLKNVEPDVVSKVIAGDAQTKVDVLDYSPEDKVLKVRATVTNRKLCVESVAPENFIYTENWHCLDLTDIPLVGEVKYWTRSYLIEQGYSKKLVNDLKAYNAPPGVTAGARNPNSNQNLPVSAEHSQDVLACYEVYALMDTDDDGISERRRFIVAQDGTVLENEETTVVPYAVGVVFINPHRLLGISLFDKIKQTQDINTALNRALLDNANANNKSRLAYLDGNVEVDDLADSRINGAIRVKGVSQVQQAIMPFQTADLSVGILANIEHQKRNRSELGGASLELATGQAQLASAQVGSQGLDRAYSVMEQLASMMTKTIAETLVRNTFLLTHTVLRQYFDQPVNFRIAGKWQSAIPSQWPERHRLNVKVGMSAGERNRKVQALDYILNKQQAVLQAGGDGVLVNLNGFHNALIDWGRAAQIDNPEKYWMDPESPESIKGAQKKAASAQAQDQAQKDLMDKAIGIEQLKLALDKYKADADRQFKYYDAVLSAEVEESKIVGSAATELVKSELSPVAQASEPAKSKPEVLRVARTFKPDGSAQYAGFDASGKLVKVMEMEPRDETLRVSKMVDKAMGNGSGTAQEND